MQLKESANVHLRETKIEKEILQIVCVHFHADSLPKALEAAMAVLISNHLSHWSIPKRPREVYPKKFI